MSTNSVAILGVGLIGASIGMRLRRIGSHVVGFDCDAEVLEAAQCAGAIDAVAPPETLRDAADVVVIATHLESTVDEIARLAREPSASDALVIDVASVKLPVVRAADGLKNFVATHPMAGSERSGVAAARADLFESRAWAYVPSGDDALDVRACTFILECGGVPVAMGAQEHDRAVALTSHVPQFLASCYAELLQESGPHALALCGPVARELLRIAGMNPTMWHDVFAANAREIRPQLRRLTRALEKEAAVLR